MKERDIQGAVLASESRDVTRGEVGSPRGSKRNLLIASSQSKFDGASGNKTATRVTPRGDSGGGEGWGRGRGKGEFIRVEKLGWVHRSKNSASCTFCGDSSARTTRMSIADSAIAAFSCDRVIEVSRYRCARAYSKSRI